MRGSGEREHPRSPDGFFGARKGLSHFAQLGLGLPVCNTMHSKTTLGVVDQTETLSRLVKAEDNHKASRADRPHRQLE